MVYLSYCAMWGNKWAGSGEGKDLQAHWVYETRLFFFLMLYLFYLLSVALNDFYFYFLLFTEKESCKYLSKQD